MDENKKVEIISKKNAQISITIPGMNLRKEWNRKGAKVSLTFGQLQEAYYDPGVEYLFTEGLLYINDMEVKKELGLEPEDAVEPENVLEITDAILKRALGPMPVNEFENWFSKLKLEQKREVAHFAIENEIINYDKCQIIQNDIGINIIRNVEMNKMANEPIKEETNGNSGTRRI